MGTETPGRARAPRLSAQERREAILDAARPILVEHGPRATTRLIAEAAGIAEGTIFRTFATKDDLVAAVFAREMDPEPFFRLIERIDPDLPLRQRLVLGTTALQQRFAGIFALLTAAGAPKPPDDPRHDEQRERFADRGLTRLLEPDAARLRLPVAEAVDVLRLLTFAATHPHLNHRQQPMSPEAIVDVVLHGVLDHDTEEVSP
ncbi:TetR/AcrR family transcriptional regulator [Nocardioides marinquilinus]|uniref:TetR/AcrR family transcriptional regulator n=1 Tax=Nocardioides marinquilinus TaxID=1210400 RepID=A0ABP9PD57_9ACTN